MTNEPSHLWRGEGRKLALLLTVFLLCVFLPVGNARFHAALTEGLSLVRWYARGNVLFLLIPAFFMAGAIESFVSKAAIVKYFGAKTRKPLSYGVASVSGSILTVCSCSVLPLFAGICRKGAGLGPATTFLYSGPAINLLAILLTARVLGPRLGVARAVGAVFFSVVIGLAMHALHGNRETERDIGDDPTERFASQQTLWGRTAALVGALAAVLIFANWARTGDVRAVFLCCPAGLATAQVEGRIVTESEDEVVLAGADGFRHAIPARQIVALEPVTPSVWRDSLYRLRWAGVAAALWALLFILMRQFAPDERKAWALGSWGFAKRILPLLLAGPALSLPSLLVIGSVLGPRRTLSFAVLVIVMATASGLLYGGIFG